jgi:hypothetical protein
VCVFVSIDRGSSGYEQLFYGFLHGKMFEKHRPRLVFSNFFHGETPNIIFYILWNPAVKTSSGQPTKITPVSPTADTKIHAIFPGLGIFGHFWCISKYLFIYSTVSGRTLVRKH